jgi:hypothetical protein
MVKRTAWDAECIRMMRNGGSQLLRYYTGLAGKWCFHFQTWKMDFLTLKFKGERTFESSVTIYQSTQRNLSEDLYFQ